MDRFDVSLLFEKESWNCNNINSMKSSHIINTLLMLRRNAEEYKRQYEYFLIDNKDGKMLTTVDDINRIAQRDAQEWIVEVPVFKSLLEELKNRQLDGYYDVLVKGIYKS